MKFPSRQTLSTFSEIRPTLLVLLTCTLSVWDCQAWSQASAPAVGHAPLAAAHPSPEAVFSPSAAVHSSPVAVLPPPAAIHPSPIAEKSESPEKLNDNGAALAEPDLSLYQGQLAAMQKLQRDNLELKLQLEQAQLKAKISASENNGKIAQGPDGSPYVVNLTGVGDARQALVSVPGYGQVTVRAGDILPNQWKVLSIDDGGVVAATSAGHHAKPLRLPFHADGAVPGRPA